LASCVCTYSRLGTTKLLTQGTRAGGGHTRVGSAALWPVGARINRALPSDRSFSGLVSHDRSNHDNACTQSRLLLEAENEPDCLISELWGRGGDWLVGVEFNASLDTL